LNDGFHARPVTWRNASLILGSALVLLVCAYSATAASAVASWSHDPFSHGYLVIPAAGYLAWTRRRDLESLKPAATFWALPPLVLIAFLWLLGNLTNTAVVQQFCLVAMVVGLVWGLLGSSAARALLFPLGFLLFALPLGDRIVPVLQDFTASFAVKLLQFSGVPVLLEGHVISIPGSRWQVAEACGGINYLVSSLAVGYVFAGTAYKSWTHRLSFFAASALLPLVANGFRVYTTIVIASFGYTGIAAGLEHNLYGWLVFALTMILLFVTCGRWEEPAPDNTAQNSKSPEAIAPASSASRVALVGMVGLLIVGSAPLSARLLWPGTVTERSVILKPWAVSAPWRIVENGRYAWAPRFVTPSGESLQDYGSSEYAVKAYVAYYDPDRPGLKLVNGDNALFEDPWWPTAEGRRAVSIDGESIEVRETTLRSPQSSMVVLSWYWVDGRFTGSDYVAKLLLAKARLFRGREGSAVIVVAAEDQSGVEAAAILKDFLAHVTLARSLETVRVSEP
jgi:exosortase A